jgi:hypothetical protein
MTSRARLAKWLFGFSAALGAVSLPATVYFGIDVVPKWFRPPAVSRPPLTVDAHPIEVVARGVETAADLVAGIGDGIVQGLFYLALTAFGIALALFLLSRKLRPPTSPPAA